MNNNRLNSFQKKEENEKKSELDLKFMKEHNKYVANNEEALNEREFTSKEKAETTHDLLGILFFDQLAEKRGY